MALAPRSPAQDAGRIQSLYLDDAFVRDDRDEVELRFRALTAGRENASGLGPLDVSVWEDDRPIPPESVRVERLESSGRGITAVVALDASGTMRGEPFARAVRGALAFLDRLGPRDRVAVLVIASDVVRAAGFDLSRDEARAALRELRIERERAQKTLLYDGVRAAVELIRRGGRDLPRRAFVVLFSDGEDDGSRGDIQEAIEAARGTQGEPPVLLYSIGYLRANGSGDMDVMRRLAQESGGEFLEARAGRPLEGFFDFIAAQVTTSYVARFPSELDGDLHQLRIAVQGRSAQRVALYPDRRGQVGFSWLAAGVGLALAGLLIGLGVARARGAASLHVVSGAKAGVSFRLRRGRTRIGALEDNEVVLLSERVSRYHAEIVMRGRRGRIFDLRSTNGTAVNGELVSERTLRWGDRIRIADVELEYRR